MKQRTFKLKEFAQDISVAVKDAQLSPLKRFVGLEHYDSNEPVITRFTDTSLLSSSVKEFSENDILIARRNVYLRRAGIVFFSGLTSGDSIVLRIYNDCEERTGIPKDDAIRIIPFILNSNDFWAYANKHADGMNSKRISKDMLYDYEFSLPSIEEQRILADKLWAAYRLKESYKKLLIATQEMVKSQFIEMFGNPVANNKGWSTMAIKQVAPEEPSRERQTGTVWILNLDMIESHTGKIIDKVYDEDTNLLSVAPFDEGNVLYSKLRPYLNKVVIPKGKGYATTELVPLRPNQEYLNLTFFSYLLRGDDFVTYANTISSGTKMPRMPLNDLRNFQCILPPMEEQLKFEKVAEQADKSEFVGCKSQFIEMFGDPMTNSKGWVEYGKINQYAQIVLGSTPNSKEASYWDGNIKWITPAEMTDESYYIYDTDRHITEDGVKSASLTLLPYRSVLFSTRAPIGKVGLVGSPMYCNQGFKNFICGDKLNPVYLYYTLVYKREYLVSLGTGTTFKELSKRTVEGLDIAIPPLSLQEQFENIYHQADKSEYYN